jgi:hypothetical protein
VQDGFAEWLSERAVEHGVTDVRGLDEFAKSSLSGMIALEYMAAHPWHTLQLALHKAYIFWVYPIAHTDHNPIVQAVAVVSDFVLYLGVALGAVALWQQRHRLRLVFGAIVFFALTQVLLHSEARFRLPLLPLLSIVFGAGGTLLADRSQRNQFFDVPTHKMLVMVLVAVVVIVYSYTGFMYLKGSI